MRRSLLHIATAIATLTVLANAADAGDYSSDAEYNHPYGMSAGQDNQPPNSSLRDSNGNLTIVNGQFTSSTMSQQSGVQQMATVGTGGSNSGSLFGSATAIGNSLNVVTTGSNNTVIVDSQQTNNGNQTATTTINGK